MARPRRTERAGNNATARTCLDLFADCMAPRRGWVRVESDRGHQRGAACNRVACFIGCDPRGRSRDRRVRCRATGALEHPRDESQGRGGGLEQAERARGRRGPRVPAEARCALPPARSGPGIDQHRGVALDRQAERIEGASPATSATLMRTEPVCRLSVSRPMPAANTAPDGCVSSTPAGGADVGGEGGQQRVAAVIGPQGIAMRGEVARHVAAL